MHINKLIMKMFEIYPQKTKLFLNNKRTYEKETQIFNWDEFSDVKLV